MRWPILSTLLVTVLLMSCSTNHDVVGRGPFQARKYRPGWQVDLRGPFGRKHDGPARNSTVVRRIRPILTEVARGPSLPPAQPRAAVVSVIARTNEVLAKKDVEMNSADVRPRHTVTRSSHEQDIAEVPERSRDARKWNTLSLIAAAGVALGFIALFIGGGAALWSYLLGLRSSWRRSVWCRPSNAMNGERASP